MKGMVLVFILVLVASSLFSQILPGFEGISPGKYPLADWVRPGLVVVYRSEGGMQTQGSAVYGAGYAIYIVTNVTENTPYGILIRFLSGQSGLYFEPPQPTIVPVYVNPQEILDTLAQREELARQGIAVSGGQNPDGNFWISYSYRDSSTTLMVSPDGKVLRNNFLEKQPNGSSVMDMSLEKTMYIDWPGSDFPDFVEEAHTYSIYSYSPMTGTWMPFGQATANFKGFNGPFAVYEVIYQTSTYLPPAEEKGLPSIGPFYIHPALLVEGTILGIPDIGFLWKSERGEDGYPNSIIYINGQDVYRARCDWSGLVLSLQYSTTGMIMAMELAM